MDENIKVQTEDQHEQTQLTVPVERNVWDAKVWSSFGVAVVFLCIGFYKIWVYKNGELSDPINAYVGGDAYNYIINASMGTAYFVASLIFVVLGCTFFITNHLVQYGRK